MRITPTRIEYNSINGLIFEILGIDYKKIIDKSLFGFGIGYKRYFYIDILYMTFWLYEKN